VCPEILESGGRCDLESSRAGGTRHAVTDELALVIAEKGTNGAGAAFEFEPDASGAPVGRGGIGTLMVNGQAVARRAMPRTIPFSVQSDESFDIGLDTGSSVDEADYQTPFAFTGRLERLVVTLGDSTLPRPAAGR
jgi:hypothetical protein